jgi:hypothetical protein
MTVTAHDSAEAQQLSRITEVTCDVTAPDAATVQPPLATLCARHQAARFSWPRDEVAAAEAIGAVIILGEGIGKTPCQHLAWV